MIKILILTPTSIHKEYCLHRFAQNVKAILENTPNADMLLIDNTEQSKQFTHVSKVKKSFGKYLSNKRVTYHYHNPKYVNKDYRKLLADCQNLGLYYAIQNKYDYIFSLESDIFPPETVINDLLKHNKAVIGYSYFVYTGVNSRPMFWDERNFGYDREGHSIQMYDYFINKCKGKLERTAQLGLGAILLKVSTLENNKIRFRSDGDVFFSDIFFHQDLKAANIACYCDTSIFVEHDNRDWNPILGTHQKLFTDESRK